MPRNNPLLHGTLDFLILKAVSWTPVHGYGIARWVERATDDALGVEEGSLYPALHRLEKQRLVAGRWGISEHGRRAKYYRLTPAGERQLAVEQRRWEHFASAMAKFVAAQPHGG